MSPLPPAIQLEMMTSASLHSSATELRLPAVAIDTHKHTGLSF